MKLISLLFLLVILAMSSLAQSVVLPAGNVKIYQDERITLLTEQYGKINKLHPSIDGYRIQIYFESGSNSRKLANDAASLFTTNYPTVKTYVTFNQPYYRVRVGNFRTLIEAVGFLKQISVNYPSAFPVKDKIAYPDL